MRKGSGLYEVSNIYWKSGFCIDQKKQLLLYCKTDFIREWWENQDSVTLITRPRRFGKTLNMSMTEYFFSVNHGDSRKYFEELNIWSYEKFRELQGSYPVISLSFADIKATTYESARKQLSESL